MERSASIKTARRPNRLLSVRAMAATVGACSARLATARSALRSRTGASLALVVLVSVWGPPAAAAQSWTREAGELVRLGRTEEAVERLERAEATEVRSRDELGSLYALRAEAREVLGDHEGARADLRRLLALEPSRELPAAVALPLRRMLDEERAAHGSPLAIGLEVQRRGAEVQIHVEARNAPADLVHGVRVSARAGGRQEWSVLRGALASFPAQPLDTVELVVELVGPRGIVLATRGTPASPERFAGSGADALATTSTDSDDGETIAWVTGVAIGILVAGAAVVGIAAAMDAQPSDHTALDGPVVRF